VKTSKKRKKNMLLCTYACVCHRNGAHQTSSISSPSKTNQLPVCKGALERKEKKTAECRSANSPRCSPSTAPLLSRLRLLGKYGDQRGRGGGQTRGKERNWQSGDAHPVALSLSLVCRLLQSPLRSPLSSHITVLVLATPLVRSKYRFFSPPTKNKQKKHVKEQ
jgi:hypothetical protein